MDLKQETVCCAPPDCCDMRGYLSFSILYLLGKKPMYGGQIAKELAARRFDRPNPGTLYPALKGLQEEGLIRPKAKAGRKVYRLTQEGREGLRDGARFFVQAYGDIVDDFRRKRL